MLVQVNLMQYMKLSTSRDFRINAETLEAVLQEQDSNTEVKQSHILTTSLFFTVQTELKSFFHVVGKIRESVFTGRSTGSRGDTGAQTEEEKTLIVRIHLQMILIILYEFRPTSARSTKLFYFVQRSSSDVDDLVDVQGLAYRTWQAQG